MRVAAEVRLSAQDRKKLEQWSSSRSTPLRLRERWRMVLLAADGMTNQALAAELGLDSNKADRRLRTKADRILPALFLKMFGDSATNPMGWPEEKLGSQVDILTGNTLSTKEPDNYDHDLPWARPADLDSGPVVAQTECSLSTAGQKAARVVPAGSVLVVCIGTVGKVGFAGKEMAISQQINAVLPSPKLASEFAFVQCILAADRFRAAATKSTLPILNKSRFASQRIIVPPLALQEKFAEQARSALSHCSWRSGVAMRLHSLFLALLKRAFSGVLTARWRQVHMKEWLQEMQHQATSLQEASRRC